MQHLRLLDGVQGTNMEDRVKMYLDYKHELCAVSGIEDTNTKEGATHDVEYVAEALDAEWIAVKDWGKEIGFIILAFGRNLERDISCPKVDYFIQDTYIKPEYRHKGIMSKEVNNLLDKYKGIFGLYILYNNKPAQAFWYKIIGDRWIDVENLGSDEYGKEYAFDTRKES